MIITIDGPAGTGKTTIARILSQKLRFEYFDTGALYRALTYQIGKLSLDLTDKEHFAQFLKGFQFNIRHVANQKKYFVDGEDVTEKIRTPEVTRHVSEISALPEVRGSLISIQRAFSEGKDTVFEGRDMGTVVFPQADFKFFLTARPAVRAERRYHEFKEKGTFKNTQEVLEELSKRDHLDSTREIAPLKQAEDALLIDTSDMTIDQVVEQMLNCIKK